MPSHSSFWRSVVHYGERQRPERRSRELSIYAQVAYAPRTVPMAATDVFMTITTKHANYSDPKKDRRKTDCGTACPGPGAVRANLDARGKRARNRVGFRLGDHHLLGDRSFAAPALVAMALMINSQRARGESLREVGLGAEHFFRALRLLAAPTLIACAGFAAIGYSTGSFHRTSHFWVAAAGGPVWALIQQYASQAFVYRRVRFLLIGDGSAPEEQKKWTSLAILVNAAIFSSAHAPN